MPKKITCYIRHGQNLSGYNLSQSGGTAGEVISYQDWTNLTPEEQASGDFFIPDFPITASTLPIGGSTLPIGGSILPISGFDTIPTIGSYSPVTSDGIAKAIRDREPYDLNIPSSVLTGATSPFDITINDSNIIDGMKVMSFELSNPSALSNDGWDWVIPTGGGSIEISGEIYAATDLTIRLQKVRALE